MKSGVDMSEEKHVVDFDPGTCVADGDIVAESENELVVSLCKEIKSKKDKKSRKSRIIKAICWTLSIIIISASIGYVGLTFIFDFLGFGSSKKVDINIPQGSTAAQISQILEDEGVIRSGLMFRVYSKLKGYDAHFKYGVYVFSADMSYERIAKKLQTEGEKAEAIKVVIPEGATVDEIADKLEKYGVCTAKDFKKALRRDDYDYDFLKTNSKHKYKVLRFEL